MVVTPPSYSSRELIVSTPGLRLDKYVSLECSGVSRSHAQRLIQQGYILVNQQPAKTSLRLNEGDHVSITIPSSLPSALAPEPIPLAVVYEDSDLLVIDKPAGLPVHPAPGHLEHTLVNAVLAHCPALLNVKGTVRPGIVHRLDKDTSGLMIVAKNTAAQEYLASQFKARAVTKRYLVLVRGHPSPKQGLIEAAIGRDSNNRKRMAIVSGGKEARTQYEVVEYLPAYTLLEVIPETGRSHQIRVHLSAIGYPVAGDATYGGRVPHLRRQFIHAHRLGFRLPSTGEFVEFKSCLPLDLEEALLSISGENS